VTQNARLRAPPRAYDASQKVLPAKKVPQAGQPSTEKAPMSRRPIALLVLAIASFVLGACTSLTAPTQNESCRSGYIMGDGRCAS
jgi:hypothetical protein